MAGAIWPHLRRLMVANTIAANNQHEGRCRVGYLCMRVAILVSAVSCGLLAPPARAADWKPVRPINLIVPWAAGGSTDQVTRLGSAETEKPRGQTIASIHPP